MFVRVTQNKKLESWLTPVQMLLVILCFGNTEHTGASCCSHDITWVILDHIHVLIISIFKSYNTSGTTTAQCPHSTVLFFLTKSNMIALLCQDFVTWLALGWLHTELFVELKHMVVWDMSDLTYLSKVCAHNYLSFSFSLTCSTLFSHLFFQRNVPAPNSAKWRCESGLSYKSRSNFPFIPAVSQLYSKCHLSSARSIFFPLCVSLLKYERLTNPEILVKRK